MTVHDDRKVDLVGQYLNEIGSVPLLTAKQEIKLSKHIETGRYAAHLLRKADEQAHHPPNRDGPAAVQFRTATSD